MPRLPVISGRQAVRKFRKLGYDIVRQRGSHIRLIHPDGAAHQPLTIPNHKELGRGLLRKLLRDSGLSLNDFNNL